VSSFTLPTQTVARRRQSESSNFAGEYDLLPVSDNTRQADREGRPAPRRAFDRNVSAHHPTEAATDGEPEAGAAVLARRRCVSLDEVLKQLGYLLRVHTDSTIGYAEQGPASTVLGCAATGDLDRAVLGELCGIAGEVEKSLTQPRWIGADRVKIGRAVDLDAIALLLSQRTDSGCDLLDERRGVAAEYLVKPV
jgi:hypothetical protein